MLRLFVCIGVAAAFAAAVVVGCGSDDSVSGTPLDAGAPDAAAGGKSDTGTTSTTLQPFSVGGSVTGLVGGALVLQNNGGDDVTVTADGTFVFPTKLTAGKPFAVTVKEQPPTQTCTVSGGNGTVATAAVTSVTINCATDKYTVGGTVYGLAGSGLVLQNNLGNDVTIGANGTFAFPTPLPTGAEYAVTIKTQPTKLSQTCIVTNDSGTIASANVTDVHVACVTNNFTVGVTVTGLDGTGLVLQNNGAGDLAIDANGTFMFPAQTDGTDYAVTVKTQPTVKSQTCTVTAGNGKLAGANVDLNVACVTNTYSVGGTISGLTASGLVLTNNGGNDLTVASGATGFTFTTPIPSGSGYDVAVKTQPAGLSCWITNAVGTVTDGNVANVTITCAAGVVFSRSFTDGVSTTTADCDAWNTFGAQIQAGTTYGKISIKGTNDPTGRSCTGATANTLCQAIRTRTTVNLVTCDGNGWSIREDGGIYRELQADGQYWTCGSKYAIRACIGNSNWGGVNSASCPSTPSQTITVTCE